METLVLFDIDGTLIDPGEAGARAIKKTFFEMFSIENAFSSIKMDGKTDIQIIKEGLYAQNLAENKGIIGDIISTYLDNLANTIKNNRKRIMPGVIELLNALKEAERCWLGLLTGNIRRGADIKLRELGLEGYFSVGAFGDDNEDRNKLLPVALEKFKQKTQIGISFSDCVVIGDTPLDVACAKPYGAKAVAVATGSYSYEELQAAGADYVLENLENAYGLIEQLEMGR